MTSKNAIIQLRRLRKEYGSFVAVDDVEMNVPEGAVLALVGPNGAGKTSLMKMMAGLLEPTSGSVMIAGQTAVKQIHQKLGFLPDFFGLYDDLSVEQYLYFFALAYGLTTEDAKKRASECISMVGLQEKTESTMTTLSRGMRQRVGIARTLINDPPLLLLDEPSAGLDPEARFDLQNLFKKLAAHGKTLVVSSHILTELEEYSTHVAMIRKGKLVAMGATREIRDQSLALRFIKLRVAQNVNDAVLLLKNNPHVNAAKEIEKSIAVFEFRGNDMELGETLKQLIQNGIPVLEFNEEHGRIQNAYLALMKGHSE